MSYQRKAPRPSVKNRLATRLKQKQALELGLQDLTYEQIAKAMGYRSKGTICKLIHAALDAVPAEAREAYRRVEDQRLEALFSVYHPMAMAGDIDAAKYVETLIGRRSRLMGIEAPPRAAVNEKGETVGTIDGQDPIVLLTGRLAGIAARLRSGGSAGGTDRGAGGAAPL